MSIVLTQKATDLALMLVDVFFEKIELDERFKNDRMSEWQEICPKPERAFNDGDPRVEFAQMHDELVCLENMNSPLGISWLPSVKSEFSEKLQKLKDIFQSENLHPVNENLIEYHEHILRRANDDYQGAIDALSQANSILNDNIQDPEKDADLMRDMVLNLGYMSLLHSALGDQKKSLTLCEEMAVFATQIPEGKLHEIEINLSPLRSWVYYFYCSCLVDAIETDLFSVSEKRSTVFTAAFGSENHFRNWNPPAWLTILRSAVWEANYSSYHTEIANLLYPGTALNSRQKAWRRASLLIGRRRLQPMPLVATLVFLAYISVVGLSGSDEPQVEESQIVLAVKSTLECLEDVERESFINEIEPVFAAVSTQLREIDLSSSRAAESITDVILKQSLPLAELTVAVNGNERVIRSLA